MGKSAKPPAPPDTSRFTAGLERNAEQNRQWAQQMWDQGQQEWGRLQEWSSEYLGQAFPAMEDAFDWAREQRDNFNEYVMPQYQSLFADAETYASKEEETRQRGKAIQDVASATEAERQSHLRNLDSYGLDTAKERELAIDRKAGVQAAGLKAMAANLAGERTQEVGRQIRGEAIDAGQTFLREANVGTQQGGQLGAQALAGGTNAASVGSRLPMGALPFSATGSQDLMAGAGIVDTSYGRQIDYADARNRASELDRNMYADIAGGVMTMWDPTGLASKGLKTATGTGGSRLPSAMSAEGGPIAAPGGPTSDGGAIAISDGEYVVPADVVRKLGTNHFDKMIEKETGRPPPSQKQAIPIPGGRR